MSLLNLLLNEVEKNGGIAKTYDRICIELTGFDEPLKRLEKKQRHIVRSEGATKYIRANYDTKPIKEIAEYLDTNYSMVQARIRQLGLKKPMIRKKSVYIQKTCKIMNIETGKVFENMSIAARSADLNINTFQAKIRKFGCYKKFIKVA